MQVLLGAHAAMKAGNGGQAGAWTCKGWHPAREQPQRLGLATGKGPRLCVWWGGIEEKLRQLMTMEVKATEGQTSVEKSAGVERDCTGHWFLLWWKQRGSLELWLLPPQD